MGKTIRTLQARWSSHCGKGSGCWALSGAIRKYGRDAFTITALVKGLSDEDAETTERSMVHKYKTKAPSGYNLTEGGQGSAHKNPNHGANIAKAWTVPETRERHMTWRTFENLSAKVNQPDTWIVQQKAWMAKRLVMALSLSPLDGSQLIWFRAVKSREHAMRKGREQHQLDWLDNVRDSQILECWKNAGLPAPPASSWMVKTTAYEKRNRGGVSSSRQTLTKSRPSCASTGVGERAFLKEMSGDDSD